MKHLFYVLLIALAPALIAQGTETHYQKPDGNYTYHYFQGSKKISSTLFWPSQGWTGYAVAYNMDGNEIYRQEISRMHMIRTVRFSYHPNGAVSKAEMSWHPDAGIQHGTVTTTFDENGKLIKEEKWSSEDKLGIPDRPSDIVPIQPNPKKETPQPFKQEIVIESPVYQNTYFIINRTKRSLTVQLLDNTGKPMPEEKYKPQTIAPGDTLQGKTLLMAGIHAKPCEYFKLNVTSKKPKWAQGVGINCNRMTIEDLSPTSRKTYFDLFQGSSN